MWPFSAISSRATASRRMVSTWCAWRLRSLSRSSTWRRCPARGQGGAALLQLVAATIELQRGLLLRALDALEPGLLGEERGARARSGLRDGLLASGGGTRLGVGEQRDAPRAQRKAGGEGLTGHVLLVGAHLAHPLKREDKGGIAHAPLVGPGRGRD